MELLQEFNPLTEKMMSVMDDDGQILRPDLLPADPHGVAKEAWRRMLYVRTADQMCVSYQRQGRMYTYPPNFGQEAIGVGVGMVMNREEDWLVTAYRELGAWLAKGITMKELFLYFGGHEDGSRFLNAPKTLPFAVPISSQNLHAVGIGYAMKYKKEPGVVFVFFGDGGTSEGDFHEALNFAGVWKVPVIFVCQNNQYAISCPRSKQTASRTIAIKAMAYGITGIQVDGNDIFAMLAAVSAARFHAEAGNGPVLIEAVTYRRGAHTTSDDPGRYRTSEEEESWVNKDPMKRIKGYVTAQGLYREEEEAQLVEQYKRDIDAQFTEAENYPPYQLEDVFQWHYAEMPDELKRQMMATRKYLNWKETRR